MTPIDKNSRIYVSGHAGMTGTAIVRCLRAQGFDNLVTRSHAELDLVDQHAVRAFFRHEKIDHVILCAGKVGGIHANNTYPAEFIYQNLMIEANVIHEAWRAGVQRLIFLGSACIYPKFAHVPIREEDLLTGILEPTNEPYALAKISGIKLCESYNRQYGTRYRSVMPTNLYGPFDNFHPQNSHVLPALLRKCHQAKLEGRPSVEIWGSGRPSREFLHVDDMAAATVFVMQIPDEPFAQVTRPECCFLNIGSGQDVTIAEAAMLVKQAIGYEGELRFDLSQPDGTPRRRLDVAKLTALGWQAQISLAEGLRQTYQWFLENQDSLRQ
ncbi:MAG: GDP-L-fucose synthase [Magnetococcales bacterium]|nr:GDP-L-fucose synthase [Magnetococcales bacterium]MBF0323172.1 GDP-L-fucose synthase [Magnetococcales bacterium]